MGCPVRKFETSTKVFSCYKDYQVYPVVGISRERRQSEIFVLL